MLADFILLPALSPLPAPSLSPACFLSLLLSCPCCLFFPSPTLHPALLFCFLPGIPEPSCAIGTESWTQNRLSPPCCYCLVWPWEITATLPPWFTCKESELDHLLTAIHSRIINYIWFLQEWIIIAVGLAKEIFFPLLQWAEKSLPGGTFHNSAEELGNCTTHLLSKKALVFPQFLQ